jgi:hypothetical protein
MKPDNSAQFLRGAELSAARALTFADLAIDPPNPQS